MFLKYYNLKEKKIQMLCGFNEHIQRKLLQHTFVVGANSDLG